MSEEKERQENNNLWIFKGRPTHKFSPINIIFITTFGYKGIIVLKSLKTINKYCHGFFNLLVLGLSLVLAYARQALYYWTTYTHSFGLHCWQLHTFLGQDGVEETRAQYVQGNRNLGKCYSIILVWKGGITQNTWLMRERIR